MGFLLSKISLSSSTSSELAGTETVESRNWALEWNSFSKLQAHEVNKLGNKKERVFTLQLFTLFKNKNLALTQVKDGGR